MCFVNILRKKERKKNPLDLPNIYAFVFCFYSNDTFPVCSYYDVSVGITDPMAFIPPKECMG